jgi:hypothetical protein
MNVNTFYVVVNNKRHVPIRTESRFFDITNRRGLTDGKTLGKDGLIPIAKSVSNKCAAEWVAKSARAKVRRSRIRRFRMEEIS